MKRRIIDFLFYFFLTVVCLSVPSYGQTIHFDASDTSNIFTMAGNPPTGTPSDGSLVEEWTADTPANTSMASAAGATWRSPCTLLLPCLDFDGADDLYGLQDTDDGGTRSLDTIINNNAFAVLISLRLDGAPAINDANPYDNDCIICDNDGYWGIYARNDNPSLQFYNYDGNEDIVSLNVSADTNYIVGFRHESGSIFGSLNCGSETSALSGNTDALGLAAAVWVAFANIPDAFASVRIGEIKVWDTGNAGGNFATECAALHTKWVAAAGTVPSVFLNLNGAQ